jgi:hypothetical protein
MADVKAIITDAATRYGQDPDVALRIAKIESTLNPSAQNKASSAGGLFQFIDSTWGTYAPGKSKYDPEANADAGMRYLRDNRNYLTKKLGREPTPGELYLAHQQGAGGAAMILSNPSANAVELLGRKKVLLNGGDENMTAGEFAALWAKKMGDANYQTPLVTGGQAPASMAASQGNGFQADQPASVSYEDVVPATSLSQKQEVAQQNALDAAAENAPGFIEGAGLAVWNNWSVLAPFRALGHHDPDPNWTLTEDRMKELGRDIPTEYLSEFEDAISDQHAEAIRQRLVSQIETNTKIASMGMSGVGLSFGAAMTDPAAIAATLAIGAATAGTGLAPAIAARAGRAGMIALGAAEGVAGNLATDIPLVMVDPTMKAADLKYSIGTGVVMGGAFGAFGRNPAFAQERADMLKAAKAMQREAVDSVGQGGSSAGAAQVLPRPTYRADSEELQATFKRLDKDTEIVFGRARFDLAGQLLKSKNPMVKGVARFLVEDAVRARKGSVTEIAASEHQARLFRTSTNEWVRGYGAAWDKYRKANNISFFKSADALDDFKAQVSMYVRETDPFRRGFYPPEVKEAGEAFNAVMQKWWKAAGEEGLTRTEAGVANYFPRYANLAEARSRMHRYGYDDKGNGLTGLFAGAIRKAQPDLDEKLVNKFAYAILERFKKTYSGGELNSRGVEGLEMDDLSDILKGYVPDDEIEQIVEKLRAKDAAATSQDGNKGGNARLMQRILFDENHSAIVRDRNGLEQEVRVSDFYINDPNLAMHLYSRQMSGQVAMARVKIRDPETGELLLDGVKNRKDWDTFIEKVKGVGELEDADIKADVENLQFAYNAITGVPNFKEDDWSTGLRMLRDFNFTRLMGQVGFSQLPEVGRVAAQVGLKTMFAAMPEFRRLLRSMRSGDFVDELAEEMDALGAFGTDFERTRFFIPQDEYGTPITLGDSSVGRMANKVQPAQHAMNRFVAKWSGMAPVNAVFQRWASRAFAIRWAKVALGQDKISPRRLEALGLRADEADAILANIRKHAQFKGGVKKGSRLEALGLSKWDGQSAAAFEMAMYRASRNMILENDVGQFAKWMGSPLGKTIVQFRTFALSAWTKATLQGLNMNDTAAWLGFMASAFIGSLTYAGQTYVNLIGDPDMGKKLKERLSPVNLAKAGFMRTSESSLLPIGMDMMSEMVAGEPMFDMRSTGLRTTVDSLFGNPTGDLISTTFKGVKGITTAIAGDDYSRQDWNSLVRALPFQRMMGVVQLTNLLGSGLKTERRDF